MSRLKEFFTPLLSIAKTRKFWVAVAGAAMAYLTAVYGTSPEITLLAGLLTAAGIYGVRNGG